MLGILPTSPLGTGSIRQPSVWEFPIFLSKFWHRSCMYRERGGEVPCKGLGSTCPGGLLTFCAKRSCPLVEGAMGEGGRKEKGGRKGDGMLKASHDQFRMIANHLKNAFSPWLLPLSLQVSVKRPLLGEAFPDQVDGHPFILCHSLFHPQHCSQSVRLSLTYLLSCCHSPPTG